jgi:hypothetical protein
VSPQRLDHPLGTVDFQDLEVGAGAPPRGVHVQVGGNDFVVLGKPGRDRVGLTSPDLQTLLSAQWFTGGFAVEVSRVLTLADHVGHILLDPRGRGPRALRELDHLAEGSEHPALC